ncbi:MAG: PadR family transcriptional regulator [Thermomicrobiales bacterium]
MAAKRPASRRGKASTAQTRTAEHALLGLLAESGDDGVHGYDLIKRFADGALADIIRIEPGMLYHHLKSMATRGWLITTVERQASRPDRQMHIITDVGQASLTTWLAEPVRATRELRLEFLVKLYLMERLAPHQVDQLVEAQYSVIDNLIASLEQQRNALNSEDPDLPFRQHVHDLRISQNRAARQWLLDLQCNP